jgi:hypothetical protein
LLLPFVVIRLIAVERDTGALTLMLQAPVRFRAVIAAKGVALLVGWMIAFIPGALALIWWRALHVISTRRKLPSSWLGICCVAW